jgi:hypothetical protein
MSNKIDKDRRSYWLEKVIEWQKSGLSVKEWCKKNKLSFQALYFWKKKLLLQEPINVNPDSFIELKSKTSTYELEIEYKKYKFKPYIPRPIKHFF